MSLTIGALNQGTTRLELEMSLSSSFFHSPLALKVDHLGSPDMKFCGKVGKRMSTPFHIRSNGGDWSFKGGSRIIVKPKASSLVHYPKSSHIHASCFLESQLASTVFKYGTEAVLPFYTLMILAPKSELTKKFMESVIPYVALGVVYAYLVYLSWTPETFEMIFVKLPELTGIEKLFSNELTLTSAWIHLLVVDLFAARYIFQDGLENQIETRHSVFCCLFFCPIGILAHVITKEMTKTASIER